MVAAGNTSAADCVSVTQITNRAVVATAGDERFPDVAEDAAERITLDHDEVGGGYGMPTSAGRSAKRLLREEAGIPLDTTYTAKAMAALLRRARDDLRGRELLFVNTLSSAALDPAVQRAPVLPRNLRRLLIRG